MTPRKRTTSRRSGRSTGTPEVGSLPPLPPELQSLAANAEPPLSPMAWIESLAQFSQAQPLPHTINPANRPSSTSYHPQPTRSGRLQPIASDDLSTWLSLEQYLDFPSEDEGDDDYRPSPKRAKTDGDDEEDASSDVSGDYVLESDTGDEEVVSEPVASTSAAPFGVRPYDTQGRSDYPDLPLPLPPSPPSARRTDAVETASKPARGKGKKAASTGLKSVEGASNPFRSDSQTGATLLPPAPTSSTTAKKRKRRDEAAAAEFMPPPAVPKPTDSPGKSPAAATDPPKLTRSYINELEQKAARVDRLEQQVKELRKGNSGTRRINELQNQIRELEAKTAKAAQAEALQKQVREMELKIVALEAERKAYQAGFQAAATRRV